MIMCDNCSQEAKTKVQWVTSKGRQTANFCAACCKSYWEDFKSTPAGQSSIFSPIEEESK